MRYALGAVRKTCAAPRLTLLFHLPDAGTERSRTKLTRQRLSSHQTIRPHIALLMEMLIKGFERGHELRLRNALREREEARTRSWPNLTRPDGAKQLLIDFLCASAGGPLYYVGRDMKTSHRGMGISEGDWQAFIGHV